MNGELDGIHADSIEHNLVLNPAKSVVVVFGGIKAKKLAEHLNIEINNVKIPVQQSAKSLGVIIDGRLNFVEHVNILLRKSYFNLKLLYSNKQILSRKLRKILVESLVLSNFNYCSFVYGPFLTIREQQKIQRVQNSCVRFIFGLRKYDHISPQFRSLSWLNMLNRRKLQFAVFIKKIMLTSSPLYLRNKLVSRADIHNVNTRHRVLLAIPRHVTALFRRGFAYQAVHMYNSFTDILKLIPSINLFKKRFKQTLLNDQ